MEGRRGRHAGGDHAGVVIVGVERRVRGREAVQAGHFAMVVMVKHGRLIGGDRWGVERAGLIRSQKADGRGSVSLLDGLACCLTSSG